MPATPLNISVVEETGTPTAPLKTGPTPVDLSRPLESVPVSGEPQTQNQGIIGRLSDPRLGMKIGGGITRGLFGQTLKTFVQLPQSFAAGVAGLAEAAGVEGAGALRERIAKPITAPIVGEVKPLSAVPTDIQAATPKETLGQAIGMLPEAATLGVFKLPLTNIVPKTALGKLAQSFGVGAEFGGLAGGSQALLADKEMKDVLADAMQTALVAGTLSAGITAATMIPTGELAKLPTDIKGLYQRSKEYAVSKMKSLMPFTTGIKKADVAAMSNPDIAPRMIERIKILQEGQQTGNLQEAQDQLKQLNLDKFKTVYDRAKTNAETAYGTARSAIEKQFGSATVGGKNVLENSAKKSVQLAKGSIELGVDNVSPVVRISGDQSGSEILTDMYRRVQRSGSNPNVNELFSLKDDLQDLATGIEQGTRSSRAAGLMIDSIDSELNRITAGRTKDMNAAYRLFKQAQDNLRPLWQSNVRFDTQMNFVKNLENQAKSGSRKALDQLEKIAGFDGLIRKELNATRLARILSSDRGITGPRILDDVIRTLFISAPAATGGAVGTVFGPAGAGAGATLGATAGAMTLKTLQSPQYWIPIITKHFANRGIQITAEQTQNLVNSPLFQQSIQTLIKGLKTEAE